MAEGTPRSPRVAIDYDATASQTIFVDGASGFRLNNGVCRINLFQEMYDSNPDYGESDVRNIVACRLAIPLPAYFSLLNWMNDQARRLQELGVVEIADADVAETSADGTDER